MDPVTAFSLACGVIQVVDFGSRALSMCKEIYKKGELSEYKELEETRKHLVSAQNDIRLPSAGPAAVASQTPQDKKLSEIAKDCSAIAAELTTKLQTLKAPNAHRKRDRIKVGYKAFREKSHMQELQRRLESYRTALDTQILLGLRQQLGLVSNMGHATQALSQQVQTMINKLSQGSIAFDELANAIRNEHAETREHITEQLRQYEKTQDHREYRKRFLDSLWFDELWSREERIVDAHRKTFEWIFDGSGKGIGRWDNFVEWLEHGKGIYWIKGKAGSGKSTLMSFLGQDSRIPESLEVWAGDKGIIVPKFYFWSGGKPIERSTEGLLRSLLWQILNQLPDLQLSDPGQNNGHSIFAEPIAAWTERRLRAKLAQTVQQALQTHNVCFFIDGLDEFAGDQEALISFIEDIVKISGIKMCLSSRPEEVFAQAFASSSKLQLQDLTKKDIQSFVMDKLQGVPEMMPLVPQDSDWLEKLTQEIRRKAQGVFLWVSLAVKDQIRGLRNGDNLDQLRTRLTYLPDEVEGIYARMLNQIEIPYRREASIFLEIALFGRDESLSSHILASRNDLDAILGSDDPMPALELVAMSDRVRNRIGIACAGLLEIYDREQEDSEQEDSEQEDFEQEDFEQEDFEQDNQDSESTCPIAMRSKGEVQGTGLYNIFSKRSVGFIHRTAVDFMESLDGGAAFLRLNTPSDFDARVFHVKCLLTRLRLFGYGSAQSEHVRTIMSAIRYAEYETDNEQTTLCRLMDSIMWRIDQTHHGKAWGKTLHWSTRWGPSHLLGGMRDMLELDSKIDTSLRHSLHYARINMAASPEWDFLLLASSYGLHRYVEKVLDHGRFVSDRDVAVYLLYGSMLALGKLTFPCDTTIANLDFANKILKRDVDLKRKVNGDLTLWSIFVGRMHQVLRSKIFDNDFYHTDYFHTETELSDLQNQFAKSALAFIDRGADLAEEKVLRVKLEIINPSPFEAYVYWLDLSALAILESCLIGQRELVRIRDVCKSAGALLYARCIMFQVRDPGDYEKTREEYEPSESESSTFVQLYNQDLRTYKMRITVREKMWELGRDIRNRSKEKQSRTPHDK